MTPRKPRKMPKNQRAYPKKGKPRLVALTDPHEIQELFRGGLEAPCLVVRNDGTYADADKLRKWRGSRVTSTGEQR